MSITNARLEQLRNEFIPVKKQIDDIDRKYSLNYVEPKVDMPESLDLPALEYEPKTEEELRSAANEQAQASFLADMRRLDSSFSANVRRLDNQILSIEEKARKEQAKYLAEYNATAKQNRQKIVNAGMLFSTVLERVNKELQEEYESKVAQSNLSADNERNAVEAQRQSVTDNYNTAVAAVEQERDARSQTAYNNLVKSDLNERTRVQKYNNTLTEKEKKYQMTRAKALEAIRQAEYNRSYAAKKLYQQMGATGYEESMLWEKYNVFVSHFANFTKREEALVLVQSDNYVRGHLLQYYTTLLDWINRNVPA